MGNGVTAYNGVPYSYIAAAWTFYPNGTYTAWDSDTGNNCGLNGGLVCTAEMKWGTYSYSAVNSTLTVNSTMDQNGANRFINGVGQTISFNPGTFTVNGDIISVGVGTNNITLNRVE